VLLGLLAQLSNVDIGSDHERNVKSSFANVCHSDTSTSIGSQALVTAAAAAAANDDDYNDDSAFTHSGALTIKSCQKSLDSFFSSTQFGLFAEPFFTNGPRLEPAVAVTDTNSCNHSDGDGCFTPTYVANVPQSADCGGMLCHGADSDSGLREFLSELGLGKYADVFEKQDVDFPMFLTLSEDDLKEVGIRYYGLSYIFLDQIAISLLCAQINSASNPWWDGK